MPFCIKKTNYGPTSARSQQLLKSVYRLILKLGQLKSDNVFHLVKLEIKQTSSSNRHPSFNIVEVTSNGEDEPKKDIMIEDESIYT